jgi:flagellar capping protein FliD
VYKIEGTIDLKISRKELELLLNSLKLTISVVKNRSDNLDLHKRLLKDLAYVEKQWEKKEEEYYKSKETTTRR